MLRVVVEENWPVDQAAVMPMVVVCVRVVVEDDAADTPLKHSRLAAWVHEGADHERIFAQPQVAHVNSVAAIHHSVPDVNADTQDGTLCRLSALLGLSPGLDSLRIRLRRDVRCSIVVDAVARCSLGAEAPDAEPGSETATRSPHQALTRRQERADLRREHDRQGVAHCTNQEHGRMKRRDTAVLQDPIEHRDGDQVEHHITKEVEVSQLHRQVH
mmetsp:Transcript_79867/g.258824  ORF Transcript_79867/g.258824 Transcript_79867/m.258824 type:complete len:215 (-) Transcript_79867:556-1200(-)